MVIMFIAVTSEDPTACQGNGGVHIITLHETCSRPIKSLFYLLNIYEIFLDQNMCYGHLQHVKTDG